MKVTKNTLTKSDLTVSSETARNSGLLIDDDKKGKEFSKDQLIALVKSNGSNINDAEKAFEILPDLRLATDIIVSETLSPKDLATPKMNITIDTEGLDVDISRSDIISKLNKHFSDGGFYDLEGKLYQFLEESLVTAGAVPLLTLKRTEIDNFINEKRNSNTVITAESFKTQKFAPHNKIIASAKPGDKSVLKELNIKVSDNVNYLKSAIVDMYETEYTLKELNMESAGTNYLSFVDMGRPAAPGESHPLVFKLPAESVIPVHAPGEPNKHVGYYVVCSNGYPISHKSDSSEYKKMERRIKGILNGSSDRFQNIITVAEEHNADRNKITPKDYIELFSSKIRDELKQSLNGSIYKRELEVSSHENAYSLMFNMALNEKSVDVIYVPGGMLNYIAFDYNSMGIGRSLIEKNKLFITIRAAMLISDVFGSMRNSIPQTKVNVTLDEDDEDPYHTIEYIKDQISRMTGAKFPAALSPSDILDALQKASISMNIDGGTAFPTTRVDVEDKQRNIARSDSDLTESMKKINLSGMGVSPEKVDRALEGDYAISVATTNFLEARRIMMRQKIFERHISQFIRNYIKLSGTLMQEFTNLTENVDVLISRVKFKLPNAVSGSLEANLQAYERASDLIDAMVEDQINETMLRDILQGDYMPNQLDGYREIIAAHFKVEWAREENIMPNILKITSDDNKDIADAIKNKLTNVIDLTSNLVQHVVKNEGKATKKIRKVIEKATSNGEEKESDPNSQTPTSEPEPDIFDAPPQESGNDGDDSGNNEPELDDTPPNP